jgi:hypothetical protein
MILYLCLNSAGKKVSEIINKTPSLSIITLNGIVPSQEIRILSLISGMVFVLKVCVQVGRMNNLSVNLSQNVKVDRQPDKMLE